MAQKRFNEVVKPAMQQQQQQQQQFNVVVVGVVAAGSAIKCALRSTLLWLRSSRCRQCVRSKPAYPAAVLRTGEQSTTAVSPRPAASTSRG